MVKIIIHHHHQQHHNLSQININKFRTQLFVQLHRLDLVAKAPRHVLIATSSKSNIYLIEVQGPSGARLQAGGHLGLLTSSFAPFGRLGRYVRLA